MSFSQTLPMTRRCFFTAAGLSLAEGVVPAADHAAETANLPKAALLADGDAKTYLLVFHTGQEVIREGTGRGPVADWQPCSL